MCLGNLGRFSPALRVLGSGLTTPVSVWPAAIREDLGRFLGITAVRQSMPWQIAAQENPIKSMVRVKGLREPLKC